MSSRSCQVQERFEAPEFLQDPLNKAWLCRVRESQLQRLNCQAVREVCGDFDHLMSTALFPSNVILENPQSWQSWSFYQAKMNRSFEVWFSPGAHSGAGAGGSKAEDKKKRYTVNRSSPLPSLVGVWMLAAFDRSLGQKMCAFSSCGRECKTGKLRLTKRSVHSGAHNDGYCESVVSLQLRGDKRWRMLGREASRVPFASIGRIYCRIRSVCCWLRLLWNGGEYVFRILFSLLSSSPEVPSVLYSLLWSLESSSRPPSHAVPFVFFFFFFFFLFFVAVAGGGCVAF